MGPWAFRGHHLGIDAVARIHPTFGTPSVSEGGVDNGRGETAMVPEPGSTLLLAAGLLGVAAVRSRTQGQRAKRGVSAAGPAGRRAVAF